MRIKYPGCVVAALSLALSSADIRAQPSLIAAVDAIMAPIGSDAPGAAVIVVKDGRVLLRKGYGLANLETRTAMRPEMVFEIGSVTKQFTSAAILLLVEQGKLSLTDDFRKYVPQFPDKGAPITIEHLLTHTSGIKDYTSDAAWPPLWRQDLTPQHVVDLVKDASLEFPPGTKWRYSNTAYTLLGMIIEQVSGMPYAEFLRAHVLEPAGMRDTLYGSFTTIIRNRAAGYTQGEKGWENAPYLSMAQPYAAGALMSTVDDLAAWDAAVSAGKLLKPATWAKAFADRELADGRAARYGYGWQLGSYEGNAVTRHGGGIPGYSSEVLRIPQQRLYVAVLTNADAPLVDPEEAGMKIAAEAIGRPYRDPIGVPISAESLQAYVGSYKGEGADRLISRKDTRVFMQRGDGPVVEIFAVRPDEFFVKGSFQRLSFERDGSGTVVRVVSRVLDGTPDVRHRQGQ